MAGDAAYANVSLLLHGDGANNSTTFTDNSPTPKTLTANGNAQISTAESKWGGASMKFDGNGDYLSSASDLTNLAFGTGDFTIEFYAKKSANGVNGYDSVIQTYTGSTSVGGYNLELSSTRGFFFSGANVTIVSYSTNPNDSTWHHWAITRSGATVKMFKDGAVVATATSGASLGAQQLRIGSNTYYSEAFNGYIDDLRVTKGVARYTDTFTPPTEAFANSQAFITGNVKNDANANAARTVRAYRRDTGVLSGSTVSDGTTGNFSIISDYAGEHTVIALDDDAGTAYNVLAYDRVVAQ
jgi:hypothetical protein